MSSELTTPNINDIQIQIMINPQIITEWNQTYEVCKEAIYHEPECFKYIHNKTPEICLYAVKHHPFLVLEIDNPTEEMYKWAISGDGSILEKIPNQTMELCWYAIRDKPINIQYIKEQHDSMKWFVILKLNLHGPIIFSYIQNPSEEMKMVAISKNPKCIQYIQDPSDIMIEIAALSNIEIIELIDRIPNRVIDTLILLQPANLLKYIKHQTPDMIYRCILESVDAFHNINKSLLTYDICLCAVKTAPSLFPYIPVKFHTQEMYLEAINYYRSIDYMINPSIEVIKKGLQINKEYIEKKISIYIPGIQPGYCRQPIIKSEDMGEEFSLLNYPNRVDPMTDEPLVKGCLYGFVKISELYSTIPLQNTMEIAGKFEDLIHFSKMGKNGSTMNYVFIPHASVSHLVSTDAIQWIEY